MQPGGRHGFRIPLYLHYRDASRTILFIAIICTGAIICISLAGLPLSLKVILIIFVCSGCLFAVRSTRCRIGMRLVLNDRDEWFLIESTGQSRSVRPVAGLLLHVRVILLTFRDENDHLIPLLFTSRSADENTLRRLRVRLRYGANE